ncbi:P-type conjugative transfer protein TrbL [Granulibacter bethesdensis]|uniref:P-type conjugative transfer protein TrbL n=1 Tax=Granulibacter bethesdensis TaxID=364410 RepID=UPI000909641E|nr:P-type conjugative transfer protein TrbL [Granulibacter bethesdensis]APH59708.1 Conjugal transfer protein trbL [Granulibacter bethesdensis]
MYIKAAIQIIILVVLAVVDILIARQIDSSRRVSVTVNSHALVISSDKQFFSPQPKTIDTYTIIKKSVVLILFVFGTVLLFSDASNAADLSNPTQSYQGLLDLIQSGANSWNARLLGYAKDLFWSLALIQLVWTFAPLVLKGADIGEIVGELLYFVMIIGFFYALLTNAVTWATDIVNSFRQAGAMAAGVGQQLEPGNMFGFAVQMAKTIGETRTVNPLIAGMVSLATVIVLLCFSFISAFMGVTLVESYIVINASVFFLGFGGSQWTRGYATAMARYAVAVGAKLFVLTLLIGIIIQSGNSWAAAYSRDQVSMWTMVGLSLVCAYLSKKIPDLVQSMISGSSIGNLSVVGARTAFTAATGGVSSIPPVAGGIGKAAEFDVNAAGRNIANAMDSSFTEHIKISGIMGSSESSSIQTASLLSPRVGGSTHISKSDTGSLPQNRSRQGDSYISRIPDGSSGISAPITIVADNMRTTAAAPDGASGGKTGTPQPFSQQTPSDSPSRPISIVFAQSALAGALGDTGLLSTLSVPGMERTHKLNLGQSPQNGGNGEGKTWARNNTFPSSKPENMLRPSPDPKEKT